MNDWWLAVLVFGAEYLIFFIYALLLYRFFAVPKKTRKEIMWYFVIFFGSVFIISRIASYLFLNPRPITVFDYHYSVFGELSHNGFPSDHTWMAFLASAILFQYDKRWGLGVAVLAGLVGLSRILVGVHHPIDVLASFLMVCLVYLGLRPVFKKV